MYAVVFDFEVAKLKQNYGNPYNNAYYEVKEILSKYGFTWMQGGMYVATNGNLRTLYQVIDRLKSIDWFCKSVRDIKAFKIEDYSDFTEEFK